MEFRDVTVLIAEDNPQLRQLLRRQTEAMSFKTITVGEVYQGVREMSLSDILLLDLRLLNGEARPLLEQWVAQKHMPVCVFAGSVDSEIETELFHLGAWNVIAKPLKPSVLQTILQRYARFVLYAKEHAKLAGQVRKLRRTVYVLSILVAAIGGLEIVPKLIQLFF